MAKDVQLRIGGVSKSINNSEVKVGGVYKQVSTIYVKVSGAWKEAWRHLIVTITGGSISESNASPATVGLRINTDGTIDKRQGGLYTQINASTDWIIPNSAASEDVYHVKLTSTGNGPDTGTENTWLQLNVNREWSRTKVGPGPADVGDWTLYISDDGGTTTIDSGTYNVMVETV